MANIESPNKASLVFKTPASSNIANIGVLAILESELRLVFFGQVVEN
ncbi:hypothetical protein [Nitrosopumilus sp.]